MCLCLNIAIIITYAFNYKERPKLKEIKPLINYNKKIKKPKSNKLTIKNINQSVVSDKTIYLPKNNNISLRVLQARAVDFPLGS